MDQTICRGGETDGTDGGSTKVGCYGYKDMNQLCVFHGLSLRKIFIVVLAGECA